MNRRATVVIAWAVGCASRANPSWVRLGWKMAADRAELKNSSSRKVQLYAVPPAFI